VSDDDRVPVSLDVELVSSSVVFCFCRHGCGPGLDGSIQIVVRNTGASTLTFQPAALHFSGASTFEVDRDHGLLGAFPKTVPAGDEITLHLSLQPDLDADFPFGEYSLRLRSSVGAQTVESDLGTLEIPYSPNDYCG
jgi:hypothetical protein